jgi:hypothetical protein
LRNNQKAAPAENVGIRLRGNSRIDNVGGHAIPTLTRDEAGLERVKGIEPSS